MLPTGPHVPVTHLAREATSIGDMFRRRAERSANRPAIYEKKEAGGRFQPITWRQFYDRAAAIARGLIELGLQPGERIAILGPTRSPWACYDMGAQLAGLVSVGIYPKQTPDQIRYLLAHSESRVLFVDGEDEVRNAMEAARGLQQLMAIVPWDEALAACLQGVDPRLLPPSRFAGDPLTAAECEARLSMVSRNDTALIIYTSGTTGPPKGAMITHGNVLSLLGSQTDVLTFYEDDLSLSFLPMAHAAERILACYGRISTGTTVAYASSIGSVLTEVTEVQPTIFGSVPRLFEKAYARILSEIEKKPAAVRRLFNWALAVGKRRVALEHAGQMVPATLRLQCALADRLVFRKVRAAFGGRVRQMITGAAPISPEILRFFWAVGLPIYEAYGMTEATVITHLNRPGAVRLGSVGRPIPPCEHKIAPDGEILLRGPWIFKGYFKDEAATAQTIVDGWLHTGDIGRVDEDGYLYITDRKKHLIVTAGGKNLSPANIEQAIKAEDPLISHVHAHGDRRPYVTALVAPSPLETLEWGLARGLLSQQEVEARMQELRANPAARTEALCRAMAQVVVHPEFRQRIAEAVRRGNAKLAHVEQVRRFHILDRDFSQEQGELTPTMKVKRKEVEIRHAALFDALYADGGEQALAP
ncbi:MAG: long-chain fatty acid--CoA ligase [Myxococcales bacterium]|nr:long-chain fatty acid--CoA ligase [Myxococcota bacterium]MDW8281686.1 long-chain fatty acid--CoA ligase [Myxococcales bacterium]